MKRIITLCTLIIAFAACKKGTNGPVPEIISFTPEKGSPGISVDIHGHNFDSVASHISISFNGGLATPVYATDTEMRVIVPVGATTGKISVTVNGHTGTSKDDFTLLTSGSWSQKASLPDPNPPNGRGLGIAFAVNNIGYMGFGTNNGVDYSDLYAYDPVANSWTQKASMGIGIEGAVCMVINNKAYVGISESRQLLTDTKQFWEYDPATDTWARKADFPGGDTREAVGLALGDKGYVGFGLNTASQNWWEYDPSTDAWTQKGDFPGAVLNFPSGFAINGKGYVCGQTDVSTNKMECWQYDPSTDTWAQKGDYPGAPFVLATGLTIGNKGYIIGGGEECWEYNPTTDAWTQKAFFTVRIGGAAFAIGNNGYFGTGSTTGGYYTTDLWEFMP